jgi:hypothetical protein
MQAWQRWRARSAQEHELPDLIRSAACSLQRDPDALGQQAQKFEHRLADRPAAPAAPSGRCLGAGGLAAGWGPPSPPPPDSGPVELALARDEHGRDADRGVPPRSRQLPVAVQVAVRVEASGEPGLLERGEVGTRDPVGSASRQLVRLGPEAFTAIVLTRPETDTSS